MNEAAGVLDENGGPRKRNQIEEAIARIFYPNRQKPPLQLRAPFKRPLELDRSMGRKIRS
jgi:hypothetical protein